ncbi:histidinol-phosphate transaminase [Yaniella flava]|uniref:Histidinol-phosphate transaminase n=1 Tax=Yaniella flava TaxID=287930 RepID=A0ABP5GHG5_9MICC|nr:histidinol-phosphate transaminase [Micrococcaceae bacterium]
MDSSAVYPRAVLNKLPAYQAGKPPVETPGLTPYKLASNENPYAPIKAATDAIVTAATATTVQRYPETTYADLRHLIGETYDVPVDDVTVGAGSLGIFTALVQTFAGTGEDGVEDEVIIPWRSFEAYPIVIRSAGASDIQVPLLDNGTHDLESMLSSINDRTRMIVLCTPNNPTGTVLTDQAVRDFLERVPEHILVVIDGAYLEFVRRDGVDNYLDFYREYPNVAVLRTFSKAHGLANLRVGYAVAPPQIARPLNTVLSAFPTSTLSAQAAYASLSNLDEVLDNTEKVVFERHRVWKALDELGYQPPVTEANFVWLPLGDKAEAFSDACDARALSVRAFAPEGVRVSIGEVEANDRLIQVATEFAQQHL